MYSNTKKIEALPEGFADSIGSTAGRLFPKAAPVEDNQVAILEHRLAEVRRQINAARMGGVGNIGRLSKQKMELEAQIAEAKETEAEALLEADLSKMTAAQKRALQKASATAQPKDKVSLKKAPWEKDVKEGMDEPDEDELDGDYDDRDDKDIDNDGDEDDSDEYLHNRRKAISKAMKRKQMDEVKKSDKNDTRMGSIKVDSDAERAARAKAYREKKNLKEEAELEEGLLPSKEDLKKRARLRYVYKKVTGRSMPAGLRLGSTEAMEREVSKQKQRGLLHDKYKKITGKSMSDAEWDAHSSPEHMKKAVDRAKEREALHKHASSKEFKHDMNRRYIDYTVSKHSGANSDWKKDAEHVSAKISHDDHEKTADYYNKAKEVLTFWDPKHSTRGLRALAHTHNSFKDHESPEKEKAAADEIDKMDHHELRMAVAKHYIKKAEGHAKEAASRHERLRNKYGTVRGLSESHNLDGLELDEALSPNTVRGDTYVGVPDRVVAQAKDRVKKMNPQTASAHQKAMHKALSDMGWEMTVSGKYVKEEVELEEGYTINHKTFSSAVQHAKAQVEKMGYTVPDDEWDRKVAMGPKKPSAGKTNKYTIDLMKGGKETRRKLQMQVYYDEGRYELNMYVS
jgi:hypothetical protein